MINGVVYKELLMTKLLGIIILISMIVSCKKEKNQPPVIIIDSPIENTHISSVDSFIVSGKITDDKEITAVNISIVNTNMIPVSEIYSYNPASASVNINHVFELNNAYLEGGTYYLLVSANDENEITRNYTKLIISEVETVLTGIWTIATDNGNSIISKYDQSSFEEFISIEAEFNDLSINSFSGQIQFLSSEGHLQSFNMNNKALSWEKDNLHNFQVPYYGNLKTNSNLVFVSANIGDIYGINEYGTVIRSGITEDNSYKPCKFYFHEQYIIVEGIAIGSVPTRIELLYAETGQSMQYHATDMEIVDFSSFDENRILIWGNTGTTMKVCTLNISLQHLDEVHGFPAGRVESIAQASSQKHFFLCNNSIYIYNPTSFSVSLFADNITADFIKYEALANYLYLVSYETITVINATNANQVSIINLETQILDLEFSYNK